MNDSRKKVQRKYFPVLLRLKSDSQIAVEGIFQIKLWYFSDWGIFQIGAVKVFQQAISAGA